MQQWGERRVRVPAPEPRRGHGAGTTGSALSFTYGLTAKESALYLKLPVGKELGQEGNDLALVAAVPIPPR